MAVAPVKQIVFTHKNDLAWIIALYAAIHHGDPSPEKAGALAAEIIKNLATHLPAAQAKAVAAAMH